MVTAVWRRDLNGDDGITRTNVRGARRWPRLGVQGGWRGAGGGGKEGGGRKDAMSRFFWGVGLVCCMVAEDGGVLDGIGRVRPLPSHRSNVHRQVRR